jgi:EAL domain-containing protein (putative c-di-GMP-specific phosphodiesterase class I)
MEELERLRCDIAQGFHLSRPLPADQVAGWLAATRSA